MPVTNSKMMAKASWYVQTLHQDLKIAFIADVVISYAVKQGLNYSNELIDVLTDIPPVDRRL